MRRTVLGVILVLAACQPQVPDSGAGVGFQDYDSYALRRAQREAADRARQGLGPVISDEVPSGLPPAQPVIGAPLDATGVGGGTAGADAGAAGGGAAGGTAGTTGVAGNAAISDEQDFAAVSERETIESDAERIRRNREAYQEVTPGALPERPADSDTLVIDFALATTNAVGEAVHRRSGRLNQDRFYRACARYDSQDQAQEAFLRAGGPERDSKYLDPDGDGFACFWDPAPFRNARLGAVAQPVAREVVPGGG